MARLARIVVPDLPHHVTQRGNRRETVFFGDDDYQAYLDLVTEAAQRSKTQVWAYCLMPNHVHFIMVPSHVDGLRQTFADAHRRYTGRINARRRQTGHLWQGRFSSVVMDEDHLLAAFRYVALNPVKAGLADAPEAWPWSSARAHLARVDDALVRTRPLLDRIPDVEGLFAAEDGDVYAETFARAAAIGRPLGSAAWIEDLERRTGLALKPRKRGPKPRGRPVAEAQDLFSKLSP